MGVIRKMHRKKIRKVPVLGNWAPKVPVLGNWAPKIPVLGNWAPKVRILGILKIYKGKLSIGTFTKRCKWFNKATFDNKKGLSVEDQESAFQSVPVSIGIGLDGTLCGEVQVKAFQHVWKVLTWWGTGQVWWSTSDQM